MTQSPEAFVATLARVKHPILLMLTGKIKVKGYRALGTFGKLFPSPAANPERVWPTSRRLRPDRCPIRRRRAMAIAGTKALDRRSAEADLDRGRLDAVDETCSPDYVGHVAGFPDNDHAGDKRLVGMMRAAFPDLRCTIGDQIAEGDQVVPRLTCTGTHRGELPGVPPSGNRAMAGGVTINRIGASRIAESSGVLNLPGRGRSVAQDP